MMKHLNGYKIFEDKHMTDYICLTHSIKNYTIGSDGIIDVDGDLNLSFKGLEKLPLNFGEVRGDFNCSNNQLLTLEGSPKKISGSFYCNKNRLRSLKGGPEEPVDFMTCAGNNLINLEGMPRVENGFNCIRNRLLSLEGYNYVGGNIDIYQNPIHEIILPFIEGHRDKNDLIELFNHCDIIQGNRLIVSRLQWFYEEIGVDIKVNSYFWREIRRKYLIVE